MQRILSCAVGLTMLIAGSASAQEFVVKFSHVAVDDPAVNPTAAYAEVFKSTFEQLSGGRVQVDIFPNGQLGDQRSAVQQVRKGTIQIADIASGVLASLYYPPLGIVDLPFLFQSRAHVRNTLDNDNPFVRDLIEDVTKTSGVRLLSLAPYGFRNFTNNERPIRSAADMQGLKIRTMEIVPHQRMVEALGASPVPIPWLELYTSLQTGVVDGQENTLQNIITAKFYQAQKYLTLSGHFMTIGAFIVNDEWYRSLPEDIRAALLEAEAEARLAYDGIGAVQDMLSLATVRERGMEVYAPTAAEMQTFRDATIPTLRAYAEDEYGSTFVAGFFDTLEAARQKFPDAAQD